MPVRNVTLKAQVKAETKGASKELKKIKSQIKENSKAASRGGRRIRKSNRRTAKSFRKVADDASPLGGQLPGDIGLLTSALGKTLNALTLLGKQIPLGIGRLGTAARDGFASLGTALKNFDYTMLTTLKGWKSVGISAFKGLKIAGKSTFKAIKISIISTGIGAIVIAVVALIAHFARFTKGQKTLKVVVTAISNIFGEIIDRVAKIGGALVKLFKGDFAGAWEDAKEAVSGFGDSINAAIEGSKQLVNVQENIKRLEILKLKTATKTVEQLSRQRREIKELEGIARNTNKSFREREKALAKARELGESNLKIETDLQNIQKQIALSKAKEVEIDRKLGNERSLDDEKANAEKLLAAKAEIAQIEDARRKLTSQQNTLDEYSNTLAKEKARYYAMQTKEKQAQADLDVEQREREEEDMDTGVDEFVDEVDYAGKMVSDAMDALGARFREGREKTRQEAMETIDVYQSVFGTLGAVAKEALVQVAHNFGAGTKQVLRIAPLLGKAMSTIGRQFIASAGILEAIKGGKFAILANPYLLAAAGAALVAIGAFLSRGQSGVGDAVIAGGSAGASTIGGGGAGSSAGAGGGGGSTNPLAGLLSGTTADAANTSIGIQPIVIENELRVDGQTIADVIGRYDDKSTRNRA